MPWGLSSTIISSNLQPGSRIRRTPATSTSSPTARVYSVDSAPPYVLSQLSILFFPSHTNPSLLAPLRHHEVIRLSPLRGAERSSGGDPQRTGVDPNRA